MKIANCKKNNQEDKHFGHQGVTSNLHFALCILKLLSVVSRALRGYTLGIGRILITEEELRVRVSQLGREISSDYRGKSPTFVGVLKGAFVFLSDLIRAIDLRAEVDFLGLSSYRGVSQERMRVTRELSSEARGKDLILVDSVLDTGVTIQTAVDDLRLKNPASLKVCALLNKESKKKADIPLQYIGFTIPDVFVVGYGLDYKEHYRNLPHIAVFDLQE